MKQATISTLGSTYFYALKPRPWRFSPLFKVFVTDKCLVGAWIGDEFCDERCVKEMLRQYYQWLQPWVQAKVRRRRTRESCYSTLSPIDAAFLDTDRRNFRLMPMDIIEASLVHAYSNIHGCGGLLRLVLQDRTILKLYVLPEQSLPCIAEEISRLIPGLRYTSTGHIPAPVRRRETVGVFVIGCVFLLLAGWLSYVAVTGSRPAINRWMLALGALMAITIAVLAFMTGRDMQKDGPNRDQLSDG